MADVLLAERAEDGVANRVHERVGVRMAVQTLGVRNLDAAEDEFASRDQRVNVIADANVDHGQMIEFPRALTKKFWLPKFAHTGGGQTSAHHCLIFDLMASRTSRVFANFSSGAP